ncbi:MAG: hypothetical protein AB8B84_02695 [Granulosicoccus sp.]
MRKLGATISLLALTLSSVGAQAEVETRGNVSLQLQAFPNDSAHEEATQDSNFSLSSEIEIYAPVGENGSLTATPFIRIDENDNERSRIDMREFIYSHYGDDWELNVGVGKVFWGVAESSNIVDVINQNDLVENDGSSAKLGQPMANLLLIRDWGDIDLYILPGFRERTFPGISGRPRPGVVVDTNNAQFESSEREKHVDFAGRIGMVFDEWDVGAHLFHGTARDPLFRINSASNSVVPFYYQYTQLGFDIQATLESWLLKAELTYSSGDEIDDHSSIVSGFEYSFYDIKESGVDLGIVAEWMYDERGEDSTDAFQNDLLIGLRLALNDEQSLEGLLGIITDLDEGGQLITLEASRRFGSSLKGSLQMTVFEGVENDPAFAGFADEDNLQVELSYFF